MTNKQIESLVDQALCLGTPRSPEYRAGVVAVLAFKEMGVRIPQPYAPGTLQADAYWSGNDRGWAIWHEMHDDCEAAARKVVAQ